MKPEYDIYILLQVWFYLSNWLPYSTTYIGCSHLTFHIFHLNFILIQFMSWTFYISQVILSGWGYCRDLFSGTAITVTHYDYFHNGVLPRDPLLFVYIFLRGHYFSLLFIIFFYVYILISVPFYVINSLYK